ncbi:peptidoglycan-binding protein [Leifsonia sp. A12D58]|uniref:peptidoglycan-binding protein n=1 Tax=Leifsonia sp. A12D58 TaxID=3397674 RepID=UPI0039DFC8AB
MSAPTDTADTALGSVGLGNDAKPRRTKRALLLSAVGLVVVSAVAAAIVLVQPPNKASSDPKPVNVETLKISRGDLTELVRAPGTLGYSAPCDLGTPLSGIVTGFPPAGTIVTTGHELFRVDNVPVILMHGDLPAWRAFSIGMTDGADVLQLEKNLATLGFFTREPDEELAESTATAIEKWQKSLGLEKTGTIEIGRIMFSPADVRIQAPKATIGDAAGAAVISVTGADKEVESYIETSQQSLAPLGTKVKVALPGGAETTGTVVAIGAPVEKDGTNGKSMKIPVTLVLDDPAAAESLDNVSVSIVLTQTKQKDALLLPVAALLAQPGGGFAVEVTLKEPSNSGKTTKVVPVELGAFADGFVAVTGGKLAEGDTVVVAK